MRIAELRNHPFLLLVLKDGQNEGYFSAELIHKIKQQLIDMSLRIASDNLSIIYADQINKGCEIVMGITNLGLLDLCKNDSEKAKEIINEQGVVYCFRAGWAKYAQLKKVSPSYFDSISISEYSLGINDTSDIAALHASFMKEGYKSAKLLEVYKSISAIYSANTLFVDVDEDENILLFELQKFLNTGVALLLIDSDKKAFSTSLYQSFNDYLLTTDKVDILDKLAVSVTTFTDQLSLVTKNYLQEIGLLNFTEFKNIINQQVDVVIHIQEILELPMTVANELHDDFDGGYDFHDGDEDDIAYLLPDEE